MSVCIPEWDHDSSAELLDEALRKLELAIQLLPDVRKSAYLEAVQRVPHLVETESPPIWFLRFAGYDNASEAAARLCCYWESRKDIFVERAFLPLNQTGDGALDKDDIAHLDLGSFAFLPNSVLFHDPSKYVELSEQSKLRLSFYLWSILSENEEIQQHGYVVLVPLSLSSTTSGANFKAFEDVVLRAMPARIKRAHLLICRPTQADMWTFYAEFLPKALREMVDLKEIAHITVEDNLRDFAKELATHGFPKTGLPDLLGGTWTFHQSFLHWRRERLVLERGRYNNIMVSLAAGRSGEEQTSTSTASAVQIQEAGTPLSSWKKPISVPTSATHVSTSFTREDLAMKNPASVSGNVSTSKPSTPSVKEGKPARSKHLGNAREDSNDAVKENPAMLIQGQRELEEAVKGIPHEDRTAYTEALERVPHLIKTEPGPLCFLRAENFDANAAARRAVAFWTLRKDVFGDSAFLPMHQTGGGALSQADLELLRTGFMMHSGRDSQGRSILLVQNTQLEDHKYHELIKKLKRVYFYFACVLFEGGSVSQNQGLVLLRIVDPLVCRAKGKHSAQVLSSFFAPLTVHTVVHHGPGARQIVTDSIVPSFANLFGDTAKQHHIHAGESVAELVANLRSHGIPQESLPQSLGGPWTVEKFECWCRERVDIERKRLDDAADALFQESRLGKAQSDAITYGPEASSARALSTKEHKPTADSRRRLRETEDLPGFDKKKSRRSGQD